MKQQSFKPFLIKWTVIVAVIVILGYSLIMNWYFVRGLDQSNLMSLSLEVKRFVRAYNINPDTPLPNSIHFSGYLNWENVPLWIKNEFPDLKKVSELEMRDAKLYKSDARAVIPDTVLFVVAQPLQDGNTFYLTRQIDTTVNTNSIENRIYTTVNLTWPLAVPFLILIFVNGLAGTIIGLKDSTIEAS